MGAFCLKRLYPPVHPASCFSLLMAERGTTVCGVREKAVSLA